MEQKNLTEYNILELADQWRKGSISPEEKEIYEQWYNSFDDELLEVQQLPNGDELYNRLNQKIHGDAKTIRLWPRIAVSAAALLSITVGVWLYSSRSVVPHDRQIVKQNTISPGKNLAILTLSNGKKIPLSDMKTGVIIAGSSLQYNDGSKVAADTSLYNKELTISTPRGGTYQVYLPDGTKVWLNAASSLTYYGFRQGPGAIRKVVLDGEAYFEVAKLMSKAVKMPFIVVTDKQKIEVLGTHFNVMAYREEKLTKTTLLEGSVKITTANHFQIIKPGQQAKVDQEIEVEEVAAEQSIAWKNGYFVFDDENIHTIMNQIARWYNVEIVYEEGISDEKFGGSISRYENVNEILKKLEKTQTIRFKIEGRRITVMK